MNKEIISKLEVCDILAFYPRNCEIDLEIAGTGSFAHLAIVYSIDNDIIMVSHLTSDNVINKIENLQDLEWKYFEVYRFKLITDIHKKDLIKVIDQLNQTIMFCDYSLRLAYKNPSRKEMPDFNSSKLNCASYVFSMFATVMLYINDAIPIKWARPNDVIFSDSLEMIT